MTLWSPKCCPRIAWPRSSPSGRPFPRRIAWTCSASLWMSSSSGQLKWAPGSAKNKVGRLLLKSQSLPGLLDWSSGQLKQQTAQGVSQPVAWYGCLNSRHQGSNLQVLGWLQVSWAFGCGCCVGLLVYALLVAGLQLLLLDAWLSSGWLGPACSSYEALWLLLQLVLAVLVAHTWRVFTRQLLEWGFT